MTLLMKQTLYHHGRIKILKLKFSFISTEHEKVIQEGRWEQRKFYFNFYMRRGRRQFLHAPRREVQDIQWTFDPTNLFKAILHLPPLPVGFAKIMRSNRAPKRNVLSAFYTLVTVFELTWNSSSSTRYTAVI